MLVPVILKVLKYVQFHGSSLRKGLCWKLKYGGLFGVWEVFFPLPQFLLSYFITQTSLTVTRNFIASLFLVFPPAISLLPSIIGPEPMGCIVSFGKLEETN